MPPRCQRAARASPGLLSLPPEVLVQILAAVPLADRLSRVSLTCKQLQAACSAPALLSDLDVRIEGSRVLARTRALLRYLALRSDHARSLQLDILVDEEEADNDEVAALVPACLAACAARQSQLGGGLRRLEISAGTPLASGGCLPLLTALEQLSLPGRHSSFCLQLDDSWRQLTALQGAHLSGRLLCEGDRPTLPPSLTQLCIEGDVDDFVDQEPLPAFEAKVLAGLPALRCFKLRQSPYSCGSLAAISRLTTITRLALSHLEEPPPPQALAALAASLRSLEVHSVWVEEDALEEALLALTALQCLALDRGSWRRHMPSVPIAVAALPRLQRCSLSFYGGTEVSRQGDWLGPLPALPFASLRWLALPLQLAVNNQPVLAQVRHLHTLCLELPDADTHFDMTYWSAFWQFVASHPPLRCLLYEGPAHHEPGPNAYMLLDALLLLQRRRPALEMRRLEGPANRSVDPPACWAEMHG